MSGGHWRKIKQVKGRQWQLVGNDYYFEKVVKDSYFDKWLWQWLSSRDIFFDEVNFKEKCIPSKEGKKTEGRGLEMGTCFDNSKNSKQARVAGALWTSGKEHEFKGGMEGRSRRVCKPWETLWILSYRWWEAVGDFELGVTWLDLPFRKSFWLLCEDYNASEWKHGDQEGD